LNTIHDLPIRVADLIRYSMMPYRFGFVQGHSHLDDTQVEALQETIYSNRSDDIVSTYEKKMTSAIGSGYGISYAAGRMAFYSILRALNIGNGDEVILLGFTCSVMPNAVWRTGATPVFADVDEENFGSSAESIENKITPHTKMIVAQHSFGIPCRIKEIVELGRRKGIFVVEDCAITFDSSIDGINVGNWGDAAIFSTDHSKPVNTLIGGFLYTKNDELYKKVKSYSDSLPTLDREHQLRLLSQLLFEKKYYTPENYPRSGLMYLMRALAMRLRAEKRIIFLEGDYTKPADNNIPAVYPYPAQIPAFLAQLGLMEIERWDDVKRERKNILRQYLKIAEKSSIKKYLPKIYFDLSVDICPLRFVYCHPDPAKHLERMSRYLDINWTWFKTPVIGCTNGLQDIGYSMGSCKASEQLSYSIINWPCVVEEPWHGKLLQFFQSVVSE
jgi:perosamine synthetase